jgi:hypothetical protein
MVLVTIKQTDTRLARAWYVKYPLDAHALGPYRYDEFVAANRAVEDAEASFGEKPVEVWPTGPVEEIAEYEYEVDVPEEDTDGTS